MKNWFWTYKVDGCFTYKELWGSCCWNSSYGDENGHCYRRRDKSFSHCNGPDCGRSAPWQPDPTTPPYWTTAVTVVQTFAPTAPTTGPYPLHTDPTAPPYATTTPEPEDCTRWSGCICKEGFVWSEIYNHFTNEYEYECVPDDRCLDNKVCRSDEYFVPVQQSDEARCVNGAIEPAESWNNYDAMGNPMNDPAGGPPTCFCSGNLIRRMSDGKCISEEECQAQAGFKIRFHSYYITN